MTFSCNPLHLGQWSLSPWDVVSLGFGSLVAPDSLILAQERDDLNSGWISGWTQTLEKGVQFPEVVRGKGHSACNLFLNSSEKNLWTCVCGGRGVREKEGRREREIEMQ